MKKLFHPGIIALFAIAFSSCSKSGDLLSERNNISSLKASNVKWSSQHSKYVEESKIWDFINQPYSLQLGDPNNSFIYAGSGEFVVFYVIVSEEFMANSPKMATITAIDDPSKQTIATYDLISSENIAAYPNVEVPAELNGLPYMFTIVNLKDFDPYTGNTISLYSEILNEMGISVAQIDQAFIYMP